MGRLSVALAIAATPQAIPAGSQEALELADQLEYLSDPNGQWRPGAPLPGAGFVPLTQRWSRDNFGAREADIWFKTTLEAARLGARSWLWVVANPHLRRAQSDPALLERMVCNLVANALRYTECGGVMLACRVRHKGLLLQVWDNGPGIAVQERQTVINEHFRGAPARVGDRGMGLGLSIVRRCAHLLGTEVGLRSEVGRGSCFYLLVPLAIHPD